MVDINAPRTETQAKRQSPEQTLIALGFAIPDRLAIASPFKTELGRERFLASRRLNGPPSTVFGYQRQGLLGGRTTFATWNHRFEPFAFEPRTNSYKVKHCLNYEKPNGNTRHLTTDLWFSLSGVKALSRLFRLVGANRSVEPIDGGANRFVEPIDGGPDRSVEPIDGGENASTLRPSPADQSRDLRKIAARLYGARARCGPRAKPSDKRTYHNVRFEFGDIRETARLLYERLGPMPHGSSLDRINSRGPYSLENIRYATMTEQLTNRRFRRREQFCLQS